MNAYFTFRAEKLAELKDEADKTEKVKNLWAHIDPNVK
jgi:hypothetical protein